jgi:hypothetical protein
MYHMSEVAVMALIGGATFVCSVGSSMFIAGTRWGEVRGEMRYMNDRLAKIEGMFTLTPKGIGRDDHAD